MPPSAQRQEGFPSGVRIDHCTNAAAPAITTLSPAAGSDGARRRDAENAALIVL